MEICIVDHGAALPAKKYGGTERVIWGLGRSLSEMGHKVTFIVPEGSTCDFARVIFLNKKIDLNQQIPDSIDVVHLNLFPKEPLKKPYLITCHGNVPEKGPLDPNIVFISRNHAERYNGETFVYNGLYWNDYPKPDLKSRRNGFHYLGKASWKVKNLPGAIDIANVNDNVLHVIGGKKWTSRNIKRNFKHLFNSKIVFHGMLGDNEKMRVIEKSKGLVFPVNWHEPFGLAIIESLYGGCAIFGTSHGSLPELVTETTGFLGTTVEEIAAAMKDFNYAPKICHEYAVDNFNSMRMAEDYLKLYEKVLNGEQLNNKPIFNPEKNTLSYFI